MLRPYLALEMHRVCALLRISKPKQLYTHASEVYSELLSAEFFWLGLDFANQKLSVILCTIQDPQRHRTYHTVSNPNCKQTKVYTFRHKVPGSRYSFRYFKSIYSCIVLTIERPLSSTFPKEFCNQRLKRSRLYVLPLTTIYTMLGSESFVVYIPYQL